METELEKLDAICARMNVSYEQARVALEDADGDVVQAIIDIEKAKSDLLSVGIEIMDDFQKLMETKAVNKLRLKLGSRVIAEYPVAFTALAAVAVGLAALLVSKTSIEIDQEQGALEE